MWTWLRYATTIFIIAVIYLKQITETFVGNYEITLGQATFETKELVVLKLKYW